jgi:MSHA pilin protein MshC
MSLQRPARRRGFTLPELVMTIVIVGILVAVTAPRFVSWKGFASRGFYDEAQAVVRFAQKTAIAWRRPIVVCVTATDIRAISDVISDANCAAPAYPVMHPVTNVALRSTAPNGVTLSPAGNFSFNGMGQPTPGTNFSFVDGSGNPTLAAITLTSTITDDPARQIKVEAQTGYVHQ